LVIVLNPNDPKEIAEAEPNGSTSDRSIARFLSTAPALASTASAAANWFKYLALAENLCGFAFSEQQTGAQTYP
jgi:hypothetical protein